MPLSGWTLKVVKGTDVRNDISHRRRTIIVNGNGGIEDVAQLVFRACQQVVTETQCGKPAIPFVGPVD